MQGREGYCLVLMHILPHVPFTALGEALKPLRLGGQVGELVLGPVSSNRSQATGTLTGHHIKVGEPRS
jgi:hypothetical protein